MSNDPYAGLPSVPSFTLTSTDVTDGQPQPVAQASVAFGVPGAEEKSPQLSWSGAPDDTKSYVITQYDPDAPTVSGFWHWAIVNVPGSVSELATDAGNADGSGLPEGSFMLKNDAGFAGYLGSAPPAGHGPHRYVTTVHALNVDALEVPPEASNAFLMFNVLGACIARATITPTFEQSE